MSILALSSVLMLSSCISSRSGTRLLNEAKNQTYDVIVVPGVPLENGKWSRIMKARVYWAKYLYDQGIARNIMFSGSAVYTPYVEAEVMALYAQALGIPANHIYTETRAEHSTENIYYGYRKAKKLGFNHIALASDPFQTKMLKSFTRKKVSNEVGFIPIVFDTLKVMEPAMIDPEIDFSRIEVKNFTALPERESFWKRFRGTRGLNLDEKAYTDDPVSSLP